jgi:catalase-peroxidase
MENTRAASSGTVSPETENKTTIESKCPVAHGGNRPRTNTDWWPNQVDVSILHHHSDLSDPMGKDFN